MNAAARVRREKLRVQAAAMFEEVRNPQAIATWHPAAVAAGKRLAAARGARICLQDEADQVMRPPFQQTWAGRSTRRRPADTPPPVVEVSGKGSAQVSIAGLLCLKPGRAGRLRRRTRPHRNRKGERGSFSEDDYIAFLDQAHQRLPAPIVLIRDNQNTHVSVRIRTLIAAPVLADGDPPAVLRSRTSPPPRASGDGQNVA